jgi:RNA polymerase sigma factor (sigma-70 family)
MYRRHADEVLRYARLVLRSPPDAEDVTQATFVRAFRALERGEQVRAPRNWLITIAHNECRRILAVRKRRAVEVALDTDVPVSAAESGRAEELRRALSELAPNQRRALVLRELEGRSYAEIASSLELSESAVETLLFRARRAVREQLEAALGCDEAVAMVAAEALSADDRMRLRAHTRRCSECSRLERQARGRKSALSRFASSIGLPWGLKALAAAFTASAVVVALPQAAAPRPPAPRSVRHPVRMQPAPSPPAVAPRVGVRRATPVHRGARLAAPRAVRAATIVSRAPRRPLPAPTAAAAVSPAPVPETAPGQAPPVPSPGAPSAAAAPPSAARPSVATLVPLPVALPPLPDVSLPAVALPQVALPQVDLPAVPLPVVLQPPPVAIPTVSLP